MAEIIIKIPEKYAEFVKKTLHELFKHYPYLGTVIIEILFTKNELDKIAATLNDLVREDDRPEVKEFKEVRQEARKLHQEAVLFLERAHSEDIRSVYSPLLESVMKGGISDLKRATFQFSEVYLFAELLLSLFEVHMDEIPKVRNTKEKDGSIEFLEGTDFMGPYKIVAIILHYGLHGKTPLDTYQIEKKFHTKSLSFIFGLFRNSFIFFKRKDSNLSVFLREMQSKYPQVRRLFQ